MAANVRSTKDWIRLVDELGYLCIQTRDEVGIQVLMKQAVSIGQEVGVRYGSYEKWRERGITSVFPLKAEGCSWDEVRAGQVSVGRSPCSPPLRCPKGRALDAVVICEGYSQHSYTCNGCRMSITRSGSRVINRCSSCDYNLCVWCSNKAS